MAIYHLHVKNIGRRFGRSIVAAAAYRAGETLPNEAEERESRFGGRRDVHHSEIRLPAGAPPWMADRATLWNAVEARERRKDARLAKEIEFALPRELPDTAWVVVARAMADVYTTRGHVVDLAIHDDGLRHNPHVHLLLTTRVIEHDGFAAKLRSADSRSFVTEARALWAAIANEALGKIGANVEIDARSNVARGLLRSNASHRGPDQSERKARRALAAATREGRMSRKSYDYDPEAYREVVKDATLPWRYYEPLTRREDWPPQDRHPSEDMSDDERLQLDMFWQDVDRASAVIELVYTAPEERDTSSLDDHNDRFLFDRLEARRVAEESIDKFREIHALYEEDEARSFLAGKPEMETLRQWQDLERRLHEQIDKAGYDPEAVVGWADVRESMKAFYDKLVELRILEEENLRYRIRFSEWSREQRELEGERPAPGPDGDLVPQRELDEAQERSLQDMERDVEDELGWLNDRLADGHQAENGERRADNDRDDDRPRSSENDLDWLQDRLESEQDRRPASPEPERER